MKEIQEKLEKHQRFEAIGDDEAEPRRQTRLSDFRTDELPDGAFVSPKRAVLSSMSVNESSLPSAKSDPTLTLSRPAEVSLVTTDLLILEDNIYVISRKLSELSPL